MQRNQEIRSSANRNSELSSFDLEGILRRVFGDDERSMEGNGIGFSTEQLSLGEICRICEREVDVDCPNIRPLITDMPLAF